MNDNIPGNAPRITPADVEASIASEWYINAATGVIADSFQPPADNAHVAPGCEQFPEGGA